MCDIDKAMDVCQVACLGVCPLEQLHPESEAGLPKGWNISCYFFKGLILKKSESGAKTP